MATSRRRSTIMSSIVVIIISATSISIIAAAASESNSNGKKCFFNEMCTCVDKGHNVFAEVSCLDVKNFPTFKLPPPGTPGYAVESLIVSGEIREMPQSGGLDGFKYVNKLTIIRSNDDEAYTIEAGGPYVLVNCTVKSLVVRGILDALPLTSAIGYGMRIHPKTVANLVEVTIQDSLVNFVGDSFSEAKSLARLTISGDHVSDGAFRSASPFAPIAGSLLSFNLSNNKLETYQRSFQALTNLQSLLLNANELHDISAANFSQMPGLKRLGLAGNRLASFDGSSLFPEGEHFLEILDLSRNALNAFPRDALQVLPRLKQLSLSGNNITNFTEPLPNLARLERVDLDDNPIGQFGSEAFVNLRSIQDFAVSGWDIESLDLSSFDGASGLKNVVIRDNRRLTTIALSSLTRIPLLSKIDISGNRIRVISDSLEQLLKNNTKLIVTIANETNFDCGGQGEPSIAYDAIPNVDANNDTTTPTPTNTSTATPQKPRSLTWLANLAACEVGNRVLIDADSVFCSTPKPTGAENNKNSTEPPPSTRLIDYLQNLDHSCPQRSTASSSTTFRATTTSQPGQYATRASSRAIDILLVFVFTSVLSSMRT